MLNYMAFCIRTPEMALHCFQGLRQIFFLFTELKRFLLTTTCQFLQETILLTSAQALIRSIRFCLVYFPNQQSY